MALQVSEQAQEIDSQLRRQSVAAAKRFSHLHQKAVKRKDEGVGPKKKKQPSGSWAQKIAVMRETYPQAYMLWTEADDATLKTDFLGGADIMMLSKNLDGTREVSGCVCRSTLVKIWLPGKRPISHSGDETLP
ncbi:hypothetical protein IPF89_00230 [Candidatus Saccharibacteria bacterium]|nr:MAG: hypothetical protein IPF89_00230 [Candidatus Saccharibacteria bacterium]